MGDINSDIAVIKNDISHIKDGVEEIKNNCQKRDEDCDCKFTELYKSKADHSLKIKEIEGQLSFHNKILAAFGALCLALVTIGGDIAAWFRGA